MKEFTDAELVEFLNKFKMSAVKFTHEKDSKMTGDFPFDMLNCTNGWRFVGWAESENVAPRTDAPFVCMFEQEDGTQSWCHAKFVSLEVYAYEYLEEESQKRDTLD